MKALLLSLILTASLFSQTFKVEAEKDDWGDVFAYHIAFDLYNIEERTGCTIFMYDTYTVVAVDLEYELEGSSRLYYRVNGEQKSINGTCIRYNPVNGVSILQFDDVDHLQLVSDMKKYSTMKIGFALYDGGYETYEIVLTGFTTAFNKLCSLSKK